MSKSVLVLACALAALVGAARVNAQGEARSSLVLKTRVNLGGKQVKFSRKRFYLFKGGVDINDKLIARIKAAAYTSRDCFYCAQKASPAYVSWLKETDCESPYCREISADDVVKVPEFAAAYKKGLVAFKNKPDVARTWVTTNMPAPLRDGYYLQKKKSIDAILADVTPVATVMTEASNQQATFIDILLGTGSAEKFVVSNILPFEYGGKAYTWICEVEVKATPTIFTLPASDATKKVKTCDVIVRDLPKCDGGGCTQ